METQSDKANPVEVDESSNIDKKPQDRKKLLIVLLFVVGAFLVGIFIGKILFSVEKEVVVQDVNIDTNSETINEEVVNNKPAFVEIKQSGVNDFELKAVPFNTNSLENFDESIEISKYPEDVVKSFNNVDEDTVMCTDVYTRLRDGYVANYRYDDEKYEYVYEDTPLSDPMINFINERNKLLFEGEHAGNIPEIESIRYCELNRNDVGFYVYDVPLFCGGCGASSYLQFAGNAEPLTEIVHGNCRGQVLFMDDDGIYLQCFEDTVGGNMNLINKVNLQPEKLGTYDQLLECRVEPGLIVCD